MRRLSTFLFLILVSAGCWAQTPAFVTDAVFDGSSDGTSVTSRSAQFPTSPGTSVGNAIVARIAYSSSSTDMTGCKDDGGNSYTVAVQKTSSGAAVGIAYSLNSVGGAFTVTCTTGSGHSFFSLYVAAYSNVYDVSAVVDASNSGSASSTTSVSYSLTTTFANDMLVSATNWNANPGTVSAGSGWTSHNSTGLRATGSEDRLGATATTYTVAESWTNSASAASAAVALKAGTAPARSFVWKSSVWVDGSSNSSPSSSATTFPNVNTVSVGNTMFVWIEYQSTITDISTCFDSLGNTGTIDVQAVQTTSPGAASGICRIPITTGGASQTVTVTLGHAYKFFSISAKEFTGVATTSPLDATGTTASGGSVTSISKSVTTASGTELMIAAINWTAGKGTITPGTGMNSNGIPFPNLGDEWQITGTAGSYTGAESWTTSVAAVLAVATYKHSAAGSLVLRQIRGPF